MGTRGFNRLETRSKLRRARLGAVLVLMLLAVSCTSDDADETASPAADSYAASPEAVEPGDVSGDRDSSGSVDMAAPSTTSASRTYEAEPEEEPMAEEAADYDYETAPAATTTVSAATSGVSRGEAAASDREPSEARRRCPECQANTFEDYGVNPFVDTYEDDLSTFALDVDTASYVVTRNYLEGGQLLPIEAVRVEEFVNYFDGGYQPLIDEFNVTLEAAPTPFSDPDRVMLRVGVQAPEVLRDSPFVEDRSMEELGYQADRMADGLRRDADAEQLADLIDAARRIRRR